MAALNAPEGEGETLIFKPPVGKQTQRYLIRVKTIVKGIKISLADQCRFIRLTADITRRGQDYTEIDVEGRLSLIKQLISYITDDLKHEVEVKRVNEPSGRATETKIKKSEQEDKIYMSGGMPARLQRGSRWRAP